MEQVLGGMDSVCVMLDDVLVTGKNDIEHWCNLEEVFNRFMKYGLHLKRDKCAFLQPSVKHYGLCISKEGVSLTEDRVAAIQNAPHPSNITELRSFLGLLAELAHPLNELLGNKPWEWTESCEKSFQQLKKIVTTDTVLAEPVHTSTLARFGPVRYDKMSNVNTPSIEPNRTLPNQTSPLASTELARYGTVIIGKAHQKLFLAV